MRDPNQKIAFFLVAALIFVRLTGAHYLLCLDQQEPTTDITATMHVVGLLLNEHPGPPHNSEGDKDLDLHFDDIQGKAEFADPGLAILSCLLIALFVLQRPQRFKAHSKAPFLQPRPPDFLRPLLRAPPL